MSRPHFALLAAVIEISVPLGAVYLYWRFAALRQKVAVLLGAITPLLAAYCLASAAYLFRDPMNPRGRAPLDVAQNISFWPYLATIIAALALSLIPRPSALSARYFLGLFVAPFGFVVLVLIGTLSRTV
jgi:hypothetical protein